jgi:putative ABC transport system permease protein
MGAPIGPLAFVLAVLVGTAIAVVGALALRNRVFFRMGVRNVRRRTGRTALIVVGLMLATAIIAAALGTGDTMGRTVRSSVLKSLGAGDEWVTVKGAKPVLNGGAGGTSVGLQLFDARVVPAIEQAARKSGLVDGVLPAIVQPIAVQDLTSRQTEPRVTLFAPDARRMQGFGTITASNGRAAHLTDLALGEVFLNREAADALGAKPGDGIAVFGGSHTFNVLVKDIVQYRGAGTSKSAMLVPLAHAQMALGAPGKIEQIIISNRGGEEGGVALTNRVVARLAPVLDANGLAAQKMKQEGLDAADTAGNAFMQMFSTFGSFSIAAGILLIFLIFVMLAAERRTEMGVARAIGTRRGHLVQTFLFEGAVYDLAAAAIGALLGIGVSLAMVAGIAQMDTTGEFSVVYSIRWPSVVVAYTLGVLLTFVVVAISSWRVSTLNIVSAVRNLPDEGRRPRPRRRIFAAVATLLLGTLLVMSGRSAAEAMPFMLGLSLLAIGAVPILRMLHVPDRVSFTAAGVFITGLWLLPFNVIENLVPGAQMDFSMWIVGGLLIVLGATWVVVYNADALLGATMAVLGRIKSLSAVLRISMAYPLRTRLRTGMTLAMFTLVVFTLVVGITTPASFMSSLGTVERYGGGYDVRAMTPSASAITNMDVALRRVIGATLPGVDSIANISYVPLQARQAGSGKFVDYPLRGLDDSFLAHNKYPLGSRATGYASDTQVWNALRTYTNLAVVDPWIVPHRRNWNFGAPTDMSLHGFFAEDPTFSPITVDVRDPENGTVRKLTVIGVLRDSMPIEMAGIDTSQRGLTGYGDRARPTMHLFALAPGMNAGKFAKMLESSFLANGMQADSFAKVVHDNQAASHLFLDFIQGFMGLGLVVGVAALGVIAARSVVERRQHIGVLRAIGFRASTVRLGFLLETAFLAGTAILVGTGLGLLMSMNVINDAHRQATWPDVHLMVPWANLIVIFVVVLGVALGTTYLPARRASRVYAAEALRYE